MAKVKILSVPYELKYYPKLIDDREELYGHIDHDYNKISVSTDACKYKQHQTILHEVIHGIDKEMIHSFYNEAVKWGHAMKQSALNQA